MAFAARAREIMYEGGEIGFVTLPSRTSNVFPISVPKENYSITITGYEFKATENLVLSEEELEKYINNLLAEGYSHAPSSTTRVIYPAHCICKIKVEKHKDIEL